MPGKMYLQNKFIRKEFAVCLKVYSQLNRTQFHTSIALKNSRQEQILRKGLPKKRPIDGVKNIILVSSGKGGVGKSTVAVNLAIAIKQQRNVSVGLLDADIFGPSIPMLMNLNENPELDSNDKMIPLCNYDIPCMSMGFLVDEKAALVWRGLMVMQALDRLLRQVAWKDIEYLLVDMPPGTGDVQLSISQNVPIKGAVLVSTPQDIALRDTRRGAEMYKKVDVPVLGIIQNMSLFCCPNCNHNLHLFGKEKLENLASELSIDILGDIPLHPEISESSDQGVPVTVRSKESSLAQAFSDAAKNILKKLEPS